MNDFGALILVLAAQVTLPLVGGLLLSRKRNPAAACVPLVLASLAVLVLTPLAFVPRPEFRTSEAERPVATQSTAEEPVVGASTSAAPTGIDLMKLLRSAKPMRAAATESNFDVWKVIGFVALGIASLGLARLVIGMCSVLLATGRSRSVVDNGLMTTVDELRLDLGCRRSITVRECTRIGSAATVGWLQPVILLAPTWRLWTAEERRAVLAHEIAHVARGDFLTRLFARFAAALHGYHPLAHWLANRLELRQEMAADAMAARSCGGRSEYLKSIASLALKADAGCVGPVPTFLTRPRTLLRRIAMLQVMDDSASRPRRWPALVAIGLLAAGALGLHGQSPKLQAGPIIPARLIEKERAPLDASFIVPSESADDVGIFAVRVGELRRTPGIEKMSEMYAESLPLLLGEKKVHFKLVDVEQIAGRLTLTHDADKPAPNRNLAMSLTSIRMAKDFDWIKQLKDWGSDWKEHSHKDVKYYSMKTTIPLLGQKDFTVWCYLPDARTAVLESEENIKKLIEFKGKPPKDAWRDDWKSVEGGSFALVFPDVKGKLAKKLPTEKIESDLAATLLKPIAVMCKKTSRAAIGVDLSEGLSIKLRLMCANGTDAADVDDGCQSLAKLAKAALAEDLDEKTDEATRSGVKLSSELVDSMLLVRGVESIDHVVEVRMKSKTGIGGLLKALDADVKGK